MQTHKFLWVPDAQFLNTLLPLKHFECMRKGINATLLNDAYESLNPIERDAIGARVVGDELWQKIDRVLLQFIRAQLHMLKRLGDTPAAMSSTLRKAVMWYNDQCNAVNEMMQGQGSRLKSDMHGSW